MNYRAIFIGGPIDGQERVTQQSVSEIGVGEIKYICLFGYGANTLVYSTRDATETLDLLLESYMREANETIF